MGYLSPNNTLYVTVRFFTPFALSSEFCSLAFYILRTYADAITEIFREKKDDSSLLSKILYFGSHIV